MFRHRRTAERGQGSHVGALGLAVHEDVEADALLLADGVLHVLVDHLLVVRSAQLPLLELQARAPQLCARAQSSRPALPRPPHTAAGSRTTLRPSSPSCQRCMTAAMAHDAEVHPR